MTVCDVVNLTVAVSDARIVRPLRSFTSPNIPIISIARINTHSGGYNAFLSPPHIDLNPIDVNLSFLPLIARTSIQAVVPRTAGANC